MIRSQRGMALVESLATMSFTAAALTGGAGLSYAAFAHMFLKRAAYEFAVCLSTPATTVSCQNTFKKSVAAALPIGRLENVKSPRYRTSVEVHGQFVIPGGVRIAIEDVRRLPFTEEATPEELKRRFP